MGENLKSGTYHPNGISFFATSSIANMPHDASGEVGDPTGMIEDPVFEKARGRLVLACRVTGLTASGLASAAKVAVTTVTRPINRKTDSVPSSRTMEAVDNYVRRHIAATAVTNPEEANRMLAEWDGRPTVLEPVDITSNAISVAVRGAVQAGVWTDAVEFPEDDWEIITVPRPDGHREYFGLKVKGNSMNLEYPEGTILICVPMYSYNYPIETGDHLIIRRWNECGQVEATVKELLVGPDGRRWLCPKSTDPAWTPILVPETPHGFSETGNESRLEVSAIVVADYRVRSRRH